MAFHRVVLQEFACVLEDQLNNKESCDVGKTITSNDLNLFSDDQLYQLKELHSETTKP